MLMISPARKKEMFSNLVTSLIDYRQEPTTAKANALDMIRCSLEDDLCRAVTLSDPLIKNNSRLFENSTTFLHFLSQLSTIDLIACNHKTSTEVAEEPALRRQLEECRKQIREQNAIKEEEIKSLKRQIKDLKEEKESLERQLEDSLKGQFEAPLDNLKRQLRDCEEQLRNKTILVKKLESQLDANEVCSKSKFEALKTENEQHLDKIRQMQNSEALMRHQGLLLETQVRELERNLHKTNEEKQYLAKELEQLRNEIETLQPSAVLEPDTERKRISPKKRISPNTGRPAVQLKDDEEMVDLRTEICEAARPQLEHLERENNQLKLEVSELRQLTQNELQRQQQELTQDKLKLQSMFEESAKNFQQAIENERSFYEKKLKAEKQQLRESINELKELLSDKHQTIDKLEQLLADKENELADCLSEKAKLEKDLNTRIIESPVKRKNQCKELTKYERQIDELLNDNAQLVKNNKDLQLSIDKLADVHLEEEEKIRSEYEAREEQLRNAIKEIGRRLGVQDSEDIQFTVENAVHFADQLSNAVREMGHHLGSEDLQYIVETVISFAAREEQVRSLVKEMGRQLGIQDSEDVQYTVENVINFVVTLKSFNEGIFDDIKRVTDKHQIGFHVKTNAVPHKIALEHLDHYIVELTRSIDAIYKYLVDNVPGVKPVSFRERGDVILDVVDSLVKLKQPAERICKLRPIDYSDSMILLNRVLVIKYFELVYDYVIVKTTPKIDPTPDIKGLIDKVKNGDSTAYNDFVIAQLTLADIEPSQTFYDSLKMNLGVVDSDILDFFRRYDSEIRNYIVEYINSKMQQD